MATRKKKAPARKRKSISDTFSDERPIRNREGLEAGSSSPILDHSWLWDKRILDGSLNMVEGRKGVGKSSFLACVAAAVCGGPLLPGQQAVAPRPVVWCGAEESWQTAILPRIVAAGGDTSWIFRLRLFDDSGCPRKLAIPSGLPELATILRANRVGLICLDPFGSLADFGLDLRVERDARYYLEALADVLGETGTAGLLTRHLRKGAGGDPLEAGLGSVAIGNTCRTIWRCDRHPEDDTAYVFCRVANNYAPRVPSLIYRLTPSHNAVRLEWAGESALSADALAEGRAGAADRDECKDAALLLRGLLAGGKQQATTILAEGRLSGMGERTMRKAKAELGVLSERTVTPGSKEASWYWLPPPGGFPPL